MDIGNSKVLVRRTSNLNMQTGEIIEKEESVLLRTKKRERFMLLYVENFNAVINLRKKSQEVLAQILAKRVTYGTNEVILDSVFRAMLAKSLETSKQVIVNSIAELVEKKVLKREKRDGGYVFYLNPFLFGQGEWNSIEKQRQQFTIDYDFVNLTAEKEVKTITAYEGLPDKEDIQIIQREHYVGEDGVFRDDVLIETKSDKEEIQPDVLEEQNVTNSASAPLQRESFEYFKAREKNEAREKQERKNPRSITRSIINDIKTRGIINDIKTREKELDLREKELAVRELELKMELQKMQGKQEKSLFNP